MCTVSVKVNDSLLKMAGINMDNDAAIAEWMQQQIENILISMALSAKREAHPIPHSWESYELSPETVAMAPKKRYDIYGDYKAEHLLTPTSSNRHSRLKA